MKWLLNIAVFLFFGLQGFGQNEYQKFDRGKWENLRENIKYRKSPSSSNSGYDDNSSSSSSNEGEDSYRFDPDRYREGDGNGGRYGTRKTSGSDNSRSFDAGSGSSWANPLMIIIGVFLVALLVYQLLFKNRNTVIAPNTEIEEEVDDFDIHTIQKSDLEIALEKALAENDFRKCIRIYFTFILKELNSSGRINWERDKTNYDFLRDLKDSQDFHGFRNAVEVFEIIWYGKRNISKEIYHQIEPDFKNYLKQISVE